MNVKKLMIGGAALALALAGGLAVYAASNEGVIFRQSVSQSAQAGIVLEGGSEAEGGVQYEQQVSLGDEGGLPLDGSAPAELPEGVIWQGSVSAGGQGGLSLVPGENSVPGGVSYTDEVAEDVSGGDVFRLGN